MIKKIDKGYSFHLFNRVMGYFAQIFGLFQVIVQLLDLAQGLIFNPLIFIVSIVIIIAGIVFSYSKEYIIIDYAKSSLRIVLDVLGVNFNKKIELNKYHYLSVLTKRFAYDNDTEDGESYYGEATENVIKHELTFLTKNHREKYIIQLFDEFEIAKKLGEELSKYTGKPLVKYSPKRISKKR